MNSIALSRYKAIHLCLILSILSTFFVLPAPAKAGVLSKVWSAIRPVTYLAGRVGGAVLGASMASAIIPPLGMIVGGVAGWIVGGILSDYASGSLSNLAAVGCGVAGAMALGPSAIGVVGGFLLGGVVGKVAMSLLQKADQKVTGGILLNKADSTAALAPSQSVTIGVNANYDPNDGTINNNGTTGTIQTGSPSTFSGAANNNEDLKSIQLMYQKAYTAYVEALKKARDSKVVLKAKEAYQKAYARYREFFNK